jgi:hypothetical protein
MPDDPNPGSAPASGASASARAAASLPAPRRTGCLGCLGLALGVLVLLVAAPFVVGWFLPERYEARMRATISRPPAEVFAAACDAQRNPMTGSMMQRVHVLPDEDGLPIWEEELVQSRVRVRTLAFEPPRRIKRALADSVVHMTAESEITIEAAPSGGSVIDARSVTTIREGTWHTPVFRFMMTIFGGADTALEGYWMHLAKGLGAELAIERRGKMVPVSSPGTAKAPAPAPSTGAASSTAPAEEPAPAASAAPSRGAAPSNAPAEAPTAGASGR